MSLIKLVKFLVSIPVIPTILFFFNQTSKCFNEGCNAEFSTSSELRKHIIGPTDDKLYGICQEALIKCSLCNYFDKRKIILGKHYINNHLTINCNVCNLLIPYTIINDHYKLVGKV